MCMCYPHHRGRWRGEASMKGGPHFFKSLYTELWLGDLSIANQKIFSWSTVRHCIWIVVHDVFMFDLPVSMLCFRLPSCVPSYLCSPPTVFLFPVCLVRIITSCSFHPARLVLFVFIMPVSVSFRHRHHHHHQYHHQRSPSNQTHSRQHVNGDRVAFMCLASV